MSGRYWNAFGEGQEFITYPEFPNMPSADRMTAVDLTDIVGFIERDDAVTFDFEQGVVRRQGIDDGEMSTSLDRIDEEYVRSLDIYADVPIRINIRDEEGQTDVGFWQAESRDFQLRDVKVKELEVMSDSPATLSIIASTEEDLGFMTEGGPLDVYRNGVLTGLNEDPTDTRMDLDDSENTIWWTPSVALFTGIESTSLTNDNIPIPQGATPHLRVNNRSQWDVGITAEVSNTPYPWEQQQQFSYLPGWSKSSPKIVSGYEDKYLNVCSGLDMDGFPGNQLRIDAWQVEQSGEEATVEMSINANA